MTDAQRGALYGIAAASIWGGMYVVSDVVLETIPPFTLLAIRLIMGTIVLWFWRVRQMPFPSTLDRWRLMGVGIVGFGISVGAQFVGTDLSTAVNGSLITSASPAFILVFAVLILRENLTLMRIFAVLLATIGVIVIIDLREATFSSDTFVGDMALAVAAITWGLYSVLVRQVSRNHNTLIITFFAFLGGMTLIIPLAILEQTHEGIGEIDLEILLGVLYLGIISTAAAMWLWNRAFALVDANRASLFFFAQPVVGTLLGVLLLHQDLTTNILLGGMMIIAGVLVSILEPAPKSQAEIHSLVE
jgi:drug/metabolite transporter (DMT)-like permease